MEGYKILDVINYNGVRVTVGKPIECQWDYMSKVKVDKIYIKESGLYCSFINLQGIEEDDEISYLFPKKS